jgi:hypothetical protein
MTSRIVCRAANLAMREVLLDRGHLPGEQQSSVVARNWNAKTLCASHEF